MYIDYDEPMRELMRRDASEGGGVLFRDAWLEAHPHPVELTGKTKDQIAEAVSTCACCLRVFELVDLPCSIGMLPHLRLVGGLCGCVRVCQLGYSFSSWDPHNRADRILVRGPGVQVSSMKVCVGLCRFCIPSEVGRLPCM